jgi:ankyrin repeat protein
MLASLYGYTEIVELLLDTGESHPEYRDNEGETALMLASTNGNTEVVKLLLNSGESHPGYQDNDGYTALIFASAYAHTEIVKLLLATGESHPEFINGDGWTALMYAIRRNNTEIIKLLEEYQKQYEPIVGNNPSVKLITDESIFSIGFNSNTIENENPLDPISLEPIPRNLLVVAVPFSDNTKTTCFNGQYLWQWWIVLVKGNPPVPANHPLTREEFDAESISSLKEFLNKNIG